STRILSITEPGIGELYQGDNSGDHRLYQEIALGFGGYKAMKELGIKPAAMQLNEAPTVFAVIAELDEMCQNGSNIDEALNEIRKNTLYTNHTLVQAVEGKFNTDQFERFVMP